MIEYFEFGSERLDEVIKIYEECEWKSYLGKNDRLKKAFDNSLFILGAFENGKLVGFIRCVGDTEFVLYIQDLIVHPSYQRKGIGRELMRLTSEKYKDIRQFLLITDKEDPCSNSFYKSIEMKNDFLGFPINHYFR